MDTSRPQHEQRVLWFDWSRIRPHFVICKQGDGTTLAVYDTKYKDLWGTKLLREILYQMSVYALAWTGSRERGVPAVVLYPTPGGEKADIEYELAVQGGQRRRIVLRAIDWARAIDAVGARDVDAGGRLARAWIRV